MTKQLENDIYEYTDYRRYLLDYYELQKKLSPKFSYRYFAKKANINSIGLYKDVVAGRKYLGRALIHRFSHALKHNDKQASYFENMVYFNEAKSVDEKKIYFRKMMSHYNSKAKKINVNQYEYYDKWYYAGIRALLSYVNFKDDYKELSKLLSPSIKESEAKKAIQILEELELIKKNEQGYYKIQDKIITNGRIQKDNQIGKMNIINHHRAMLKLAGEAYDLHTVKNLDMSALTLSFSKDTYLAIKKEIADLRKKILGMAEKDLQTDRVYQLSYCLFPLSNLEEEEK